MIAPYDKRTEETRDRIMGDRRSYIPNKYYKSAEGEFYFYINTKGYYHIIKPCRIKYDGEFSHYEIRDCLLTKDNILKEVSCGGFYKTKDEVIEAIMENLADN
jgi:hypothetical protein